MTERSNSAVSLAVACEPSTFLQGKGDKNLRNGQTIRPQLATPFHIPINKEEELTVFLA